MDEEQSARTAEAHWALHAAGLGDMIWGHASVRAADGYGVITKAAGWGFEEIHPDRLVSVAWDGSLLRGPGPVHIEVPIHLEAMLARPDVGCVVHVHSPAVAAFASLGVGLLPISHDGVIFAHDGLPVFSTTGALVSTAALGADLAAQLGAAPAILMPKHGLTAVGADPAEAVMHAVLLDRACRTQLLAASAGPLKVWSDPAEVAEKRATSAAPGQLRAGYRYLVRTGSAGRDC